MCKERKLNKLLILIIAILMALVVGVNLAISQSMFVIMDRTEAEWCIDILENGL